MRLLLVLLLSSLLAMSAHAQGTTAPGSTTAPQAAQATQPAAPAPHQRMTWQQRFAQANTAHDGHLTLDQAKGGDPTVARHFSEIDADKKGFVTEDDIRNWQKLQRAMRHANHNRPDNGLRPRPAYQRGAEEPRQINVEGPQMMPMTPSSNMPATGGNQAGAGPG